MNCLEFRRELLAGPRHLSAAARDHAGGCAACADAAKTAREGDGTIEDALLVSVPAGLEDRVLLRRGLRRPSRWRPWALAATLLVGLGVVAGLLGERSEPGGGTAGHAIAHVLNEPGSLVATAALDPAAFQSAIRKLGGEGHVDLGRLRYVRLCPMEDGGEGWHFVFESGGNVVTVLVVPDGRVEGRLQAVASNWTALVRPVPRGYVAVVAASQSVAGQVAAALQNHIRWQT